MFTFLSSGTLKIVFLIFCGFFVFAFTNTTFAQEPPTSYSGLKISGIQLEGINTDDDFLELANEGSQQLTLDSCSLKKLASGDNSLIQSFYSSFSVTDIIPANGYFLWAKAGSTFSTQANITSSANLSGNNCILLECTDKIIDAVCWGTVPRADELISQYINLLTMQPREYRTQGDDGKLTSEFSANIIRDPKFATYPPVRASIIAKQSDTNTYIVNFSSNSEGLIKSYLWNFGDGWTDTKPSINHNFYCPSYCRFTATLSVSPAKPQPQDITMASIEIEVVNKGLAVSEVYIPQSANKESWIELENKTLSLIDISAFSLSNCADKKFIFPQATIILPNRWIVVYNSLSNLSLLTKSGSVCFYSPNGTLLQKINYESGSDTQSISKVGDTFSFQSPSPWEETIVTSSASLPLIFSNYNATTQTMTPRVTAVSGETPNISIAAPSQDYQNTTITNTQDSTPDDISIATPNATANTPLSVGYGTSQTNGQETILSSVDSSYGYSSNIEANLSSLDAINTETKEILKICSVIAVLSGILGFFVIKFLHI